MRRDARTGALGPVVGETATPAPSFLTRHPRLPVLYAVSEVAEGTVSAFGCADGRLTPLGHEPSGGAAPCYLAVDPDGRYLSVANYDSGTVQVIPLDERGRLRPTGTAPLAHRGRGLDPLREVAPHTHMVMPSDGAVLTVDLGLDTIYRHRVDPATGGLVAGEPVARLPSGSGPRHFVRDDDGLVHVVCELSAKVMTFAVTGDEWKELGAVATTTAPSSLPSAITLRGRHIYVANRGPDTMAVFARTGGVPRLIGEVATGGRWPRDLAIVDDLLYVANQRSHTVVTFHLDPATGQPRPTGDVLATPSPTCVLPWS